MKAAFYLAWIAGLCFLVALVAYQGFGEVGLLFRVSGWGVIWVSLFHVVPLITFTLAWQVLLPSRERLRFSTLFRLRWISEAVNVLLPVAHIGGDLVRARLLTQAGLSRARAGASVVADITAGFMTEVVFALSGLALFLQRDGGGRRSVGLLAGLSVFILFLGGFYAAQRLGLFRWLARTVVRFSGGRWLSLVGEGEALDRALNDIYSRPARFLAASGWRLVSWALGAGEVWLALYFLDRPVRLLDALMLESISQALRSAAFFIPGGLGVQESGFMLVGSSLGLSPELGLTVSLIKRAREVLFGLPGLVAWQVAEGRRLGRRRAASPGSLLPR